MRMVPPLLPGARGKDAVIGAWQVAAMLPETRTSLHGENAMLLTSLRCPFSVYLAGIGGVHA